MLINTLSKMLLPATATIAASSVMVSSNVSAASNDNSPRMIRPSELPIYDEKCCCHHENIRMPLVEANSLEQGIGQVRIAVFESLGALETSQGKFLEFYETGKAHSRETLAYLQEDSNILARIGAITAGGLTGLLFGIRGGFFKKLFYGSISMSAVASVCYPKEASDISKGIYTIAKYYAIVGYNKVKDELNTIKVKTETPPAQLATAIDQIAEQKKNPSHQQLPVQSQFENNLGTKKVTGDLGQSNPEDSDMYTTRT